MVGVAVTIATSEFVDTSAVEKFTIGGLLGEPDTGKYEAPVLCLRH